MAKSPPPPIQTEIIDLEGDDDCGFLCLTPLSDRGTTKRTAISVEQYNEDRDLYLAIIASLSTAYGFNDDDDVRVLHYTPKLENPRISLERGNSSRSAPKPPPTFVCEICVEPKPRSQSFTIKGCSHSYCNHCVSKYVAAKLQENILAIRCPVSGCKGSLEPEYCRDVIPKEVFDRWGDALCEAVILGSEKFYCPYKDCSALLIVGEEEAIDESECPYCHRMFCARCKVKWHAEISCTEYQKLGKDERESEDIMLMKLAEGKRWKRCPTCRIYVEKTEGCLYMLCRCKCAFCYKCGTPSRDSTHYCYNCKQ